MDAFGTCPADFLQSSFLLLKPIQNLIQKRRAVTDRKGVKVIEKDAGEFAEELKNQKSRILADHSTFNHALGKVMGAMAA